MVLPKLEAPHWSGYSWEIGSNLAVKTGLGVRLKAPLTVSGYMVERVVRSCSESGSSSAVKDRAGRKPQEKGDPRKLVLRQSFHYRITQTVGRCKITLNSMTIYCVCYNFQHHQATRAKLYQLFADANNKAFGCERYAI